MQNDSGTNPDPYPTGKEHEITRPDRETDHRSPFDKMHDGFTPLQVFMMELDSWFIYRRLLNYLGYTTLNDEVERV